MEDRQATYSAPAAACAADVLHALRKSEAPLSLADLERLLPHSKSLIFRVLRELERRELVSRDPVGHYRLGIETFEMGAAYLSHSSYGDVVRGVLEQLAAETGDTVNLGVLREDKVLYLMKFQGATSYVTISRVGGRVPANCVAIGKALLAELPEADVRSRFRDPLPQMTERSVSAVEGLTAELERTRNDGYATDCEQAALGRCAIALASGVTHPGGELTAISISTATSTFDQRLAFLLDHLRHASEVIERDRKTRNTLANTGVDDGSALLIATDLTEMSHAPRPTR